ncbi:MAG TPA: META domain-containing protein [Rhodanobacteraceae bacterium]|nr:META domain-containing protein [Rhodanobacteraceae bacterium]
MRQVVFVMVAALAITGCAAQPAHVQVPMAPDAASSRAAAPESLRGTDWRFVDVEGTAVPEGVVATLRLRDGRASGKAGCNSYGASWEMSMDGGIRFGQTMSTKMACMAPSGAMQVERGVFDVLQRAVRMHRDGEHLVLLDASGQPLATLVPERGT